jgi:hypothetical protein
VEFRLVLFGSEPDAVIPSVGISGRVGRPPTETMLAAMIGIDVAPALKPAIPSDESCRLESRRHVNPYHGREHLLRRRSAGTAGDAYARDDSKLAAP